jgi:hypothetical protein
MAASHFPSPTRAPFVTIPTIHFLPSEDHCPAGKTLTTTGTLVNGGTTLLYLARKHDCDGCKLRAQCCPKVPFRKIPRDQHEAARDIARSFVGTEAFEQSRRERKKIEMRFAHLKRILKLSRLRLRAPRGAQDEFVLAAIPLLGAPSIQNRVTIRCAIVLRLRLARPASRAECNVRADRSVTTGSFWQGAR